MPDTPSHGLREIIKDNLWGILCAYQHPEQDKSTCEPWASNIERYVQANYIPKPLKIPQDSPPAPTEGVAPVSEVGQILDELATSIHNLRPGDVGSMDRVLVPIWKAEAAIERLIAEARIEERELTNYREYEGKEAVFTDNDAYKTLEVEVIGNIYENPNLLEETS